MECKDPGRYLPIMFLLYCWGSLFGVPIKVPLVKKRKLNLPHLILNPMNTQHEPCCHPAFAEFSNTSHETPLLDCKLGACNLLGI